MTKNILVEKNWIITLLFFLATSVSNAGSVLKTPLSGLVYMGNCDFTNRPRIKPDNSLKMIEAHPGVFSGVVINVTWAQLEPAAGQFDTNAIDQAIDAILEYNLKNPNNQLLARLRVWSGWHAPPWVKNAGGIGPVMIFRKWGSHHWVDVPRFWTSEYRHLWSKLQDKLAKKYDSERLIAEVANSSCSSLTDEPFIFPGDRVSQKKMRAAGYSDQAILNCLSQTAKDYNAWNTTRIEYPFNPFRRTDSGTTVVDVSITYSIMRAWRESLGARAVLSNHAIGKAKDLGELSTVFAYIKKIGPPIEFQTASPAVVIDWNKTINYGIKMGATAIEIWAPVHAGSIFNQVTTAQLLEWSRDLKKNTRENASPDK